MKKNTPATDLTVPPSTLSPRQLETVRYLALGYTNREIAAATGISVKTIDTHRGAALKRLGLRGNADLARWAVAHGIIEVARVDAEAGCYDALEEVA